MMTFRNKKTILTDILVEIQTLNRRIAKMNVEFEDLKAKVAAEVDVDAKVVAALDGIKAKLDALAAQASVDPAEVKALADSLGASTQSITDAITRDAPPEDAPAA